MNQSAALAAALSPEWPDVAIHVVLGLVFPVCAVIGSLWVAKSSEPGFPLERSVAGLPWSWALVVCGTAPGLIGLFALNAMFLPLLPGGATPYKDGTWTANRVSLGVGRACAMVAESLALVAVVAAFFAMVFAKSAGKAFLDLWWRNDPPNLLGMIYAAASGYTAEALGATWTVMVVGGVLIHSKQHRAQMLKCPDGESAAG